MNTPLQDLLAFYSTKVTSTAHSLIRVACSKETCVGWYGVAQATFACEGLAHDRANLLRQYLRHFPEQMALFTFITHLLGAKADSSTHLARRNLVIALSPPQYRETLMQDNFDDLAACLGKLWKDTADWRHIQADLADHEYPVLRLLVYIHDNTAAIDNAIWVPRLAVAS